jgi:hypothetical protein
VNFNDQAPTLPAGGSVHPFGLPLAAYGVAEAA